MCVCVLHLSFFTLTYNFVLRVFDDITLKSWAHFIFISAHEDDELEDELEDDDEEELLDDDRPRRPRPCGLRRRE